MTDSEIENQTRECAYTLWEAEGRPEGRAVEHWLAAEAKCRPPVQSRARAISARRTRPSTLDGVPVERSPRKTSTARKTKTAATPGDNR